MKTDAERMALIRQRTAQLQRQARARQMLLIDAGCMAACLALVVCLGLAMPGWAGTSVALHVSPTGTAGMLSERGADGYSCSKSCFSCCLPRYTRFVTCCSVRPSTCAACR